MKEYKNFVLPKTELEKLAWRKVFSFVPYEEVFEDYEEVFEGGGNRAYALYKKQVKYEEWMKRNEKMIINEWKRNTPFQALTNWLLKRTKNDY